MASPPGVSLMPKAREQFAEFLDQDSLERFSILYLTTSVGLRYGRSAPSQRSFSRHEDQPHADPRRADGVTSQPQAGRICLSRGLPACTTITTRPRGIPHASLLCYPTTPAITERQADQPPPKGRAAASRP